MKEMMIIAKQVANWTDGVELCKCSCNDLTKYQMVHLSYTKVRRRSYGTRGFRLNSKRFSVHRLRAKFFNFFRILMRTWRSYSYPKRTTMSCSTMSYGSSRRDFITKEHASGRVDVCRLNSFTRSNSFYSEAIEDCLEFIKRSSSKLPAIKQVTGTLGHACQNEPKACSVGPLAGCILVISFGKLKMTSEVE
ncbi:hypothetical protein LXL04_013922 [Taraxacum kok-saghyz]